MDARVEGNGKRKAKGRLDADKQEKVIKRDVVEDKIDHLVNLHNTAIERRKDFSDAVKAVAEESGMLASVVRRYVSARAGETDIEKKRECEQLSLLFEVGA